MGLTLSDPLTLEFLGALIRSVQVDQRTIRAEVDSTRREVLGRINGLEDRLAAFGHGVGDRLAGFEARMQIRFDQMQSELVRSLEHILQLLRGPEPA